MKFCPGIEKTDEKIWGAQEDDGLGDKVHKSVPNWAKNVN